MTEQAVLDRVLALTMRPSGLPAVGGRCGQDVRRTGRRLAPADRHGPAVGGGVRYGDRDPGDTGGGGHPRLTARLISTRTAPKPQVEDEPEPVYATRAEVEELTRQVAQLARNQAAMLTQLSDAVALLTGISAAAPEGDRR